MHAESGLLSLNASSILPREMRCWCKTTSALSKFATLGPKPEAGFHCQGYLIDVGHANDQWPGGGVCVSSCFSVLTVFPAVLGVLNGTVGVVVCESKIMTHGDALKKRTMRSVPRYLITCGCWGASFSDCTSVCKSFIGLNQEQADVKAHPTVPARIRILVLCSGA